jgi:hypothetical protein
MGTVPDPRRPHKGEKFATIRADMRKNLYGGECLHEWTAGEIGNPFDKRRWYEFNPSLGAFLLEKGLEKDSRRMSADTFAREHLGWWPKSVLSASPIAKADWEACRATEFPTPDDGVVCFAVKFAPDGTTGALAACINPDAGEPYVQLIDIRSMGGGVGWFTDWLVPRENDAAVIVVDGSSYSAALVTELVNAGIAPDQIETPSSVEVGKACSMLVNAVESHTVRHAGQEILDESATKCRKRKIGSGGGYGFEATDAAEATPIEACALAYWQALTTTRDQRREGLVG